MTQHELVWIEVNTQIINETNEWRETSEEKRIKQKYRAVQKLLDHSTILLFVSFVWILFISPFFFIYFFKSIHLILFALIKQKPKKKRTKISANDKLWHESDPTSLNNVYLWFANSQWICMARGNLFWVYVTGSAHK